MRADYCMAIIAEFYWGPKRCEEPATAVAEDFDGDLWPVCDAHARAKS